MARRLLTFALLAALAVSPLAAAPSPQDAAQQDREFLFRLGLMEGHLAVGQELVTAKKAQMAVPHFGHPVRELYDDMVAYLKAHNIPAFKRDLVGLEAAVTAAPYAASTTAKYKDVMAALDRARQAVPAEIRDSVPETLRICADTIATAAGEYNGAIEKGKVANLVEYHDSRGFVYQAAGQVQKLKAAHPEAANVEKFQDVVVKAETIVQPLIPEPKPRATVAQYRAIAAEAAQVAATP